ncbi:rubredoxin-like domain-containing protein [Chloroflexota bacterium]
MWSCANCHHLEVTEEKPEQCPVCGAGSDKFQVHTVPDVKGAKTLENLQVSLAAESKAHERNLAFALKAEQENLPEIAKLFRAVAEAEAIHAYRDLNLLGAVSETQENLEVAFERENHAGNSYPRFIKEANKEGDTNVAKVFSQTRDVEREHAKLYEKALEHMLGDAGAEYYVCRVCGYVADGSVPENCPICGAPGKNFRHVE